MIFTRRFGALAARPTFVHIEETFQEPILDQSFNDADLNAA